MTQEELIKMAEKAGFIDADWNIKIVLPHLEAFAKLVAAHTLMNIDPSKFMSYHERKEVGDVNPV